MKINYLENGEKDRTRPVWERIFSEDTQQFLDYYYREKNRDNEILTGTVEGRDVSMLHLNPYRLHIGAGKAVCHYIVAVATEEKYRHRGYMARLLQESFVHMYGNRVPFTFLMPADEAIYLPFDFRFIYDQEKSTVAGKASEKWTFRQAEASDAELLGRIAQEILRDAADVAVVRDAAYYRRQLLEQKSENGGIMIALEDARPVGSFLYGKEGSFEIMEPLLRIAKESEAETLPRASEESEAGSLPRASEESGAGSLSCTPKEPRDPSRGGYEAFCRACVYSLTGDERTRVACQGLLYPGERQEPVIMARIIHLEAFLELLEPVCDFRMELAVTDPILKENEGVFRLCASRGKISAEKACGMAEGEESYSVSELVQILFGYRGMADFAAFIKPLSRVFLNEVV